MKKYNMITYKLNRSVAPTEVLQALEDLMQQYSVSYRSCLFKANVLVTEYEFEGKFHSNRKRNAIVGICKDFPALEPFFRHTKEDKGDGNIRENLLITNFSEDDYSLTGNIDYSLIRNVITKVPRPYGLNDLELIFDCISFEKENDITESIQPSTSGFGCPIGSYIYYTRSVYGGEKHSYINLSTSDEQIDDLRNLFFDLANKLPGQYIGTEIQSV